MPAIALNKPPSRKGMVGLDVLENMISTIKAGSVFRNMAASFGATLDPGFQNALIIGPHGPGKTTFAKILAFEYRSAGIVPPDAPILFVDAIDLAGEYIGQSEERTKKLLDSIIDGIIVIDEIDSLVGDTLLTVLRFV